MVQFLFTVTVAIETMNKIDLSNSIVGVKRANNNFNNVVTANSYILESL